MRSAAVRTILLLILSSTTSCRSGRPIDDLIPNTDCPPTRDQRYQSNDFVRSLVFGDEDGVTAFACAFLRGAATLDEGVLLDRRPLPRTMIVRIPTPAHYYQFSPGVVSDAAACLLSVRYDVTTSDMLRSRPEVAKSCGQVCEVCSSGIFPLDEGVRKAVQEYWKTRLSSTPSQ